MIAAVELVEDIGIVEHARSVKRQDLIRSVPQCMDCQWPRRIVAKRTRSKQRIQITAVVRVPVAQEYPINLFGRRNFKEFRQRRISRIDEKPVTIAFNQVSTTCAPRCRPRPTPAEYEKFHLATKSMEPTKS
jgi:hypothetical protein